MPSGAHRPFQRIQGLLRILRPYVCYRDGMVEIRQAGSGSSTLWVSRFLQALKCFRQ